MKRYHDIEFWLTTAACNELVAILERTKCSTELQTFRNVVRATAQHRPDHETMPNQPTDEELLA